MPKISEEYLSDKRNYILECTGEILNDDLLTSYVTFEVPFYIIQGVHDYMVSQVLAEKYLEVIKAPKKEFIPFSNSAHSTNMEEPEEFIKVVRKITLEHTYH